MMCPLDKRTFKNAKAFSNHYRWHEGKMSKESYVGINKGELNGMWRGKDVSYGAIHDYIKYHKVRAEMCQRCGDKKKLDIANISGKYLRDIWDWEWLCRKCHMEKDGRITKLIETSKKTYLTLLRNKKGQFYAIT